MHRFNLIALGLSLAVLFSMPWIGDYETSLMMIEAPAPKEKAAGVDEPSAPAPAINLAAASEPQIPSSNETIRATASESEPTPKPSLHASPTPIIKVESNKTAKQDVAVDDEKIEDSHVTASANAAAIEPALTQLSLFELNSTAQQELARLGCYDAEIDGLWGRNSKAAIQQFNERSAAAWDDMPSAALVSVLRSSPDGFCNESVASADMKDNPNKEMPSYLPPWMRGEKLASVEPDAAPDQDTVVQQVQRAAPVQHRRVRRSWDAEERYRPRRSKSWAPSTWPGTAQ